MSPRWPSSVSIGGVLAVRHPGIRRSPMPPCCRTRLPTPGITAGLVGRNPAPLVPNISDRQSVTRRGSGDKHAGPEPLGPSSSGLATYAAGGKAARLSCEPWQGRVEMVTRGIKGRREALAESKQLSSDTHGRRNRDPCPQDTSRCQADVSGPQDRPREGTPDQPSRVSPRPAPWRPGGCLPSPIRASVDQTFYSLRSWRSWRLLRAIMSDLSSILTTTPPLRYMGSTPVGFSCELLSIGRAAKFRRRCIHSCRFSPV